MRYFAIPAIILFSLAACDKPYDLEVQQIPAKTVIEGQVTDQAGMQYVKVSRSNNFYATGNTPRVTDAIVFVKDSEGNVFPFVHNPNNHADSAGYYRPEDTTFKGVVGRSYSLTVEADGQVFEATDTLLPVTTMEKLEFQLNEDQQEDPEEEGKVYEVLMFVKEPQDEKNFYLFKFYRNDSLTYFNETDIYYSDDKLLGENINGIPSPVYFASGDRARVEAYSITRDAYVYLNDLFNLINSDGGIFGPPPANPRTNLSNGALGFFQVSAINTTSIDITP